MALADPPREFPYGNPYLSGNFAPVHDEVFAENLTVIGELPEALHGMFLRTGPNPQFDPGDKYHWFDGDGMLHGVLIEGGKASYRNRWVRTPGFEYERAAGKKLWTGLAEIPQFQDPPHGMLRKNLSNTAFCLFNDRLLSTWEAGEPFEISLPELETVGPVTWDGQLTCPVTAHPKVDPVTGELLFFGYSLMGAPYLHYGTVTPDGQTLRIVPIEIPKAVMMHDFAITENYTIFLDFPLVFEPMRMAEGKLPFFFDGESPARYGILPRHGDNSSIRWIEGPPCYMFHTLNAWEENGEIVMVGCRNQSTTIAAPPGHSDQAPGHSHQIVTAQEDSDVGRMHRWRFDLEAGTLKEEPIDDAPTDFPRLHPGHLARSSRYGYAARFCPTLPGTPPIFDGVIKYDCQSGESETFVYGRRRFAGEAVFAPHPDASHEDEGWVMTILRDEAEDRSELVVLDAQAVSGGPVARVMLPQRVPYGFHADWVDGRRFS